MRRAFFEIPDLAPRFVFVGLMVFLQLGAFLVWYFELPEDDPVPYTRMLWAEILLSAINLIAALVTLRDWIRVYRGGRLKGEKHE